MSLLPADLKEFLAPFRLLINRHALAPVYKCLELSPDKIRACSSFGILEVGCQLGIEETMYVDAATFMAVVSSLPQDQDLDLVNLDGVLAWGCGTAKGKLALLSIENMQVIDRPIPRKAWATTQTFAQALTVGAISCGGNTMASVGMHGVVIYNRPGKELTVATSDNITVSICEVKDTHIEGAPEMVTIAPEAAVLLASVIENDGRLVMDETSVYYSSPNTKLLLKQVTPLRHDLLSIIGNYPDADLVAPVPRDRINAFIKRTAALSESSRTMFVTLHADNGQLAISFSEATAGTDEYYLVDGLELPEGLEIKLDATKLARALAHVDEVVLDHIQRGAVIFRGKEPEFRYMVAGSM